MCVCIVLEALPPRGPHLMLTVPKQTPPRPPHRRPSEPLHRMHHVPFIPLRDARRAPERVVGSMCRQRGWGLFPGTSLPCRTDEPGSPDGGREWYAPAPRRARPADK